MQILSLIPLLLLCACASPAPGFIGAARHDVTLDGIRFAVFHKGAEAEVIAPDELRGKMAELIGAMAARYADAPLRRVAGRKG